MKKFFYLLPVFALVFTACSDSDDKVDNGLDKDNRITLQRTDISGAPSNDAIDEVWLFLYGADDYRLSTSRWIDGFSLEFPVSVGSSYLTSIADAFDMEAEEYSALKISNPNVKVAPADIEGRSEGVLKGDFVEGQTKMSFAGGFTIQYFYADGPVSITGNYVEKDEDDKTYTITYNVNLVKGWNRVAMVSNDVYKWEATTKLPAGASWYFAEY